LCSFEFEKLIINFSERLYCASVACCAREQLAPSTLSYATATASAPLNRPTDWLVVVVVGVLPNIEYTLIDIRRRLAAWQMDERAKKVQGRCAEAVRLNVQMNSSSMCVNAATMRRNTAPHDDRIIND